MTARFRVRARTVDMLGRQQIAGIPTAISELFKNAHDAYARNVEVDYFRDDGLFVLRDDGLGMTKDDFEQRWLTLGTESKLGSKSLVPPPKDPNQPERAILGEKGIGRLAIATIGSQVLVLSRARRGGEPSDVTIGAYIHWGLFELPGLNLEDVLIPMREFGGGVLPSRTDIQGMVDELSSTIPDLANSTSSESLDQIREGMEDFVVDPEGYAAYLGNPSLSEDECGTHFYIMPADPIISDDIDDRQSQSKATRFERNLIGFTNTMTPNHKRPPVVCRFRDHRDEGPAKELIGDRAFFTPMEFEEVDHHFFGRFDEYGQFNGTVGIYQTKPEPYVLSWGESDGRKTDCGPFELSFAYMQGTARDSLVPPAEHTRMRKKLDRHGGLYIYRDGIRVQPYGDSDYDWLDIERNRTLGAGYYFYSYRRMFGAVEIKGDRNWHLSEKAGREGFRENKAYRQFRSILMSFFVQTAGDFFREDGKHADPHAAIRSDLNRNEQIRRKQAKQVRGRRTTFGRELGDAFGQFDDGAPERNAQECLSSLKKAITKSLAGGGTAHEKAVAVITAEREAKDTLDDIRRQLVVTKPPGVGLPRSLANEWGAYVAEVERLDERVFRPTEDSIETYVSDQAARAAVNLNDVERLNSTVSRYADEAVKSLRTYRSDIDKSAKGVFATVRKTARESFLAVSEVVEEIKGEVETLRESGKGVVDLQSTRSEFVDQVVTVYRNERTKVERLQRQLEQFGRLWEEDSYGADELTEALEEELEELRARRDADLELAQVGLALNTISHEFEKTVGALRDGLRQLSSWASANPELDSLYGNLRASFDHLDEYLSLFTPLDRRLHRKEIEVTGKQILDFIAKLFQPRLARHGIEIMATNGFMKASYMSYPSSIYPPFVNLVDNAIFWLQRNREGNREIVLDAEGDDLLIRDNGPGVSRRDRENIFEMNFSRKPGGRGMGLHISRETLLRAGLLLTLDASDGGGASFRISKNKGKTDGTG